MCERCSANVFRDSAACPEFRTTREVLEVFFNPYANLFTFRDV